MKLSDIASLAGVSTTTASYVINGKANLHRISQKTQQKVMEIAQKYNYQADHAAISLRAGSSHTLGLIIPDLENSSYAKLAKLLEKNARKENYQLIISCSDDDQNIEMSVASTLISRGVDALIVASNLEETHDFYRNIQKKGIPVIGLDRSLDPAYFASVISDDKHGSFELTKALLTEPINSIAFLGAMPNLVVSKSREQGFLQALDGAKINIEHRILYADNFDQAAGYKLALRLIDEKKLPDAIIITSYTLFEGVFSVLANHPAQLRSIKLATFGDHPLLDYLPITVQSLSQQYELIAQKVLQLTYSAIKKEPIKGITMILRSLKLRG